MTWPQRYEWKRRARLSAGALGAAVNFNNFSGNLANAGMPALCTV
jgi:hypothetical protein